MKRPLETKAAPRDKRAWPIRDVSIGHVAYIVSVEIAALIWAITAVSRLDLATGSWARLGLLIVLALAFEEGSTRAARLQLRWSSDLKRDMTSVWAVAAAVGLPLGMSAILLTIILTFVWFRQQRPLGQPLYRKLFNAATAILSALTAGLVLHSAVSAWGTHVWALGSALPIVVAIVVHTAVNRVLVTFALLGVGVRGRELIGSAHDNIVELATLCLGGLVALAVVFEPWLAILALAPMISLQRGAVVRELETAASTDAKTGLYNAITWERIAQRELSRAERTHAPTGVLIVDLDRFKLVNDRFGHLAGDKVLRGIGHRLRSEVREYDTVGRFGGEEFVAVLPSAGDADALVVAERLRARIHDMRISDVVDGIDPEVDAPLSVSIGVACSPADGTELTDLLHSADAALYRAKNSGRNRVVLAHRGSGNDRDRVNAG